MSLKFQHYFSVENVEWSVLQFLVYQCSNNGIICTSKKQGCHPCFITASWWRVWVRKKITNLKSCTIMPLKVGLTLCTRLWGNTLVWDNKELAFETFPQLDLCCFCKCICTVDAEIGNKWIIEDICICFLLEKKW